MLANGVESACGVDAPAASARNPYCTVIEGLTKIRGALKSDKIDPSLECVGESKVYSIHLNSRALFDL